MASIRNVKRVIKSQADFAGVDVDTIEPADPSTGGEDDVYRVIINDGATEREQEGFQIVNPTGPNADQIFRDRLKQYFSAAKEQLIDTDSSADDTADNSDDNSRRDTESTSESDVTDSNGTETASTSENDTATTDTETDMANRTDVSGATQTESKDQTTQSSEPNVTHPLSVTLDLSDDVESLTEQMQEMDDTYVTRAEYESIKTDLDDIHTRLERIESLFDAMKAFMDVETTDSSTDEDNSE